MKKMILTVLFVLALVGFVSTMQAAEKNSAIPEDAKEIKMQKVDYVPATSIDFRKEFKLNFPGLTTLAGRIEAARQNCAPVDLAVCGLELKAAEAASGKTAKMTAKQLLDEAFDLAFLRAEPAELAAVKVLIPTRAETADKLLASLKETEDARGARYLHIQNNSHDCLEVIVNGRYLRGHIHQNTCNMVATGRCPHQRIHVLVRCEEDKDVHWEGHIDGVYNTYHITIN